MQRRVWGVVIVGAMVALAQAECGAAPPPPASQPTTASPAQTGVPPVVPTSEFATADDLLQALETADKDLRTLSSELLWTKEFFLGGDTHIRRGKLFFVDERAAPDAKTQSAAKADGQRPPGRRKFAVRIEATVLQGAAEGAAARLDRQTQEYVFDGTSLVERHPDEKRLIKHQLNAKADADPLKIGEGPIPLPVGQKREDMLARFDVELLPAEKDLVAEGGDKNDPAAQQLLAMVRGCAQLKLVPKPEYQRECTFKEARLWYKRSAGGEGGRLLPRTARAVDKQDNMDMVMLIDVQVNGPINAVFDTSLPDGWEGQVLGAGN